jgi:hypothetical protein
MMVIIAVIIRLALLLRMMMIRFTLQLDLGGGDALPSTIVGPSHWHVEEEEEESSLSRPTNDLVDRVGSWECQRK